MAADNRYSAIVEAIFHGRYEAGDESVGFRRDQITAAALSLGFAPPRNLGDVIYTFRCGEREALPACAAGGGHGRRFGAVSAPDPSWDGLSDVT